MCLSDVKNTLNSLFILVALRVRRLGGMIILVVAFRFARFVEARIFEDFCLEDLAQEGLQMVRVEVNIYKIVVGYNGISIAIRKIFQFFNFSFCRKEKKKKVEKIFRRHTHTQ